MARLVHRSNPCVMGMHHICSGGFTGGRCECECHGYKFSIGQQVEFTVAIGPFDETKTRTMHGKVTGRYISAMDNAVYEITLNTIKKAGRSVPVYRGISEKDMKEERR